MGNSAIEAQKLANEANYHIANETNELNRAIAESQNELNYNMFQEQNAWNLERRDEEWAYNDPSAQMRRYMKAGINPLWAISNGDPGKAQQLTSVTPAPAAGATMVAPTMQPEWDPNRLGNIVAAANNVNNSLQGFMKLGLEAMDVDTRRSVGQSQIGLNMAETMFKKSQTAGQDIFNNLNTETYDTLVGIKVQELKNLQSQGNLTDAQVENAKETKNQIIAMTNYTSKQADSLIDQTRQGWLRLAIEKQNANTNAMNAQTNQFVAQSNSYYQGEDLKLRGREFRFEREKFYEEVKGKSTDQLLEMCRNDQTWLNKFLPYSFTSSVGGLFSDDKTNYEHVLDRFDRLQYVGSIIESRLVDNPSEENYKSYREYLDMLNKLPQAPTPMFDGANTSNSSIINPSAPWQ